MLLKLCRLVIRDLRIHGKGIAKLLNISGLELKGWVYGCLLKIRYVKFSSKYITFFSRLDFLKAMSPKKKKEKPVGSKWLAHSIMVYIFLFLFVRFIHLKINFYFVCCHDIGSTSSNSHNYSHSWRSTRLESCPTISHEKVCNNPCLVFNFHIL